MDSRVKDRCIVAGIVLCALIGFFGTLIGAMYIAKGMNDALQRTFIQGRK